jgi:hypothetical protein
MAKAMNMMKVSIGPVMMLVTSGPKLACLTSLGKILLIKLATTTPTA